MKHPYFIKMISVSAALLALILLPMPLVASSNLEELVELVKSASPMSLSAKFDAHFDLAGNINLAEQGDVQAQVGLCRLLPEFFLDVRVESGEMELITGPPGNTLLVKDQKEVFKWCKKAAEQGDAYAQSELGYMYFEGEGVERDYKQAFKWSQRAAKQGEENAQLLLKNLCLDRPELCN